MKNFNNIDLKFKQFQSLYRNEPFQWGVNDCSHFSAKWIKLFIGKDIEKDMPTYSSEVEAIQVLSGLGYSSQEDSLDNYFNRVNKKQLMRGDIVGHYFKDANYMAMGIFTGESSMFKAPHGILHLPYRDIDPMLCWSVE